MLYTASGAKYFEAWKKGSLQMSSLPAGKKFE